MEFLVREIFSKNSQIFEKFSENFENFNVFSLQNGVKFNDFRSFRQKFPQKLHKRSFWEKKIFRGKFFENLKIFDPHNPQKSLFIRFLRNKFSKISPAAPKTPHFRPLRRRKCGQLGAPKTRFCGIGPF